MTAQMPYQSDFSVRPKQPRSTNEPSPSPSKPMGFYLQDPALPKLHDDYHFNLSDDYLRGSGSSRIVIRDEDEKGVELYPSLDFAKASNLSFEYFAANGLIDNPQFHQVNTFAVLNSALDLVEEEIGHELVWKDGGALVVRPHAFAEANAYYDPSSPSLNFGYFNSPFRRAPVWTCLSHDVITHELGHAILDTFRPWYVYSVDLDTPALHESFADLMAMFSALRYPSVVKHLYRETQGNMRDSSLITRMGEEFGVGVFGAGVPYLRSALEGPTYKKAPKEAHARSSVWTAAIYDILEQFVQNCHPANYQRSATGLDAFAEALAEASGWMKGMLLRALHYTPPNALTMPMLARLMVEADAQVYPQDSALRDIAKAVFQTRELWNDRLDLSVAPQVGQAFKSLEKADPVTLARMIMRNAGDLRIPSNATIKFINPRIVTTTRKIDKVKDNDTATVKEITEHYLEFSYEQTEYVDFMGELAPFTVLGGGTLVMNQDWDAVLLAMYPEIQQEDAPQSEGADQSWIRAREAFDRLHGAGIERTLSAKDQQRGLKDAPVAPGCPFVIQHSETGAYRLVRRICVLHEHATGITRTKHGIVQR